MHKRLLITITVILFGCDSVPTDPVIGKAAEELELAYITHVKPPDASFVECGYRQFEERHIVKCGVSFGSTKTAMNGFWEVVNNGGTATTYAMNGKALQALEHIGTSASITSGAGIRPFLDIGQAERAFGG